jgi:hypothetical protein
LVRLQPHTQNVAKCLGETEKYFRLHLRQSCGLPVKSILKDRGKNVCLDQKAFWTRRKKEIQSVREGVGAGGRNDPSIVCTYE